MYIIALVIGIWGLGTMVALLLAKGFKQRERAYNKQKEGRRK